MLNLTYAPAPEASGRQAKEQALLDQQSRRKGEVQHTFSCPAYHSVERTSESGDSLIFHMDVTVDDLNALQKWTSWAICLVL